MLGMVHKLLIKRLQELREIHGLTQEEVASIINTARTTYVGYESGRTQMDYKSLLILADYYKVSLDYIFGRSDFTNHLDGYTEEELEFMIRTLSVYNHMKTKY